MICQKSGQYWLICSHSSQSRTNRVAVNCQASQLNLLSQEQMEEASAEKNLTHDKFVEPTFKVGEVALLHFPGTEVPLAVRIVEYVQTRARPYKVHVISDGFYKDQFFKAT